MYRNILAHQAYIKEKLASNLTSEELRRLYSYHNDRVRDFQHERLIHLIVTLFFGCLLIGSVTILLVQPLAELLIPLSVLCGILFVLELAYIWHYYHLENGVQKLYVLTEALQHSLNELHA